jgi:glucan phosphoethanolaminetransferase (alkaline phosphatase superfamily)
MWRTILRSRWFFAAAVALFLVYAAVSLVRFTNADPRPLGTVDDILALENRKDLNVLFILVDTVRAHHIGAYGYARDTSPMFDYMADTGLLFRRHLSQSSWTKC